jgi:uncharacterized protein YjbK
MVNRLIVFLPFILFLLYHEAERIGMMRTNTEIEYKTLVSEEQFTRLLARFHIDRTISQTNTYFDTPDRKLKAMRIACRIRVSDHFIEATLKENVKVGILEYNHTLDAFDPEIFRTGEFKTLFERFKVDETLVEIGKATTMRRIVFEPLGELCFDQTTFSDFVDYELEYEVIGDPIEGFKRFMEILAMEDIPYTPAQSKMIRATA